MGRSRGRRKGLLGAATSRKGAGVTIDDEIHAMAQEAAEDFIKDLTGAAVARGFSLSCAVSSERALA